MKRSKEITFFLTEVVGESLSIATENLCPGETYCGQLPEKTVRFHLSSNLSSETPKRESFGMKVVQDLKLLFDRYQILVPR